MLGSSYSSVAQPPAMGRQSCGYFPLAWLMESRLLCVSGSWNDSAIPAAHHSQHREQRGESETTQPFIQSLILSWPFLISLGLQWHSVKVAQSFLTLCDPMDCSLPGSSVLGILQAEILEWVAIPFSRASSQPRDRTEVSHIAGGFFTVWATRKAQTILVCSSFHGWSV